MLLTDREQVYGDFYVPAFSVKVAGRDLVREHHLTVPGVEVDLKLKTMGRYSFTVANAFDLKRHEFVAGPSDAQIDLLNLFAFGTSVEIRIGYGEPSKLPLLMTGIVTELGTTFSDSGTPELKVSGYDRLYKLSKETRPYNREERRDSDVVADLVQRNGIGIGVDAQPTEPRKARIDKNPSETDLAFLEKLAKRNGVIFTLRANRLYFGPRNNDKSELLKLEWGKGLLRFSPEANLAEQVSRVEIYGWSVQDAKPIVGRAGRGEESGRESRRQSGGERLAGALSEAPVLQVRQPVHSQAEADRRARGALEERAEQFLKGDGECIGLPEVVPDTNLALLGLGRLFSRAYYVSDTTHKIDAGGYRTTFKVQETTL